MSAPVGVQTVSHTDRVSDDLFVWYEAIMIVGIVLAVIATYLLARSNRRLGERTRRRREQRRAQREAACANIDALAGRPELPGDPAQESSETDQ